MDEMILLAGALEDDVRATLGDSVLHQCQARFRSARLSVAEYIALLEGAAEIAWMESEMTADRPPLDIAAYLAEHPGLDASREDIDEAREHFRRQRDEQS